MSIILAIEPDRRRAAQLTGMARAHLRAELLVAPNASEAVEALGGRVPDVLLTAPLLPSQEEAAIGDYLRQLGSAAAHVQTLTIPLLASGPGERDRPVLSAFRRGRTQRSEAEGCDPSVFAEQITDYLREARERRAVPTFADPTPAVSVVEEEPAMLPVPATLVKRETISELLARLFPSSAREEENSATDAAETIVAESEAAFPSESADTTYHLQPITPFEPVISHHEEPSAAQPAASRGKVVAMPMADRAETPVDVAVAVTVNVGPKIVAAPLPKRSRTAPSVQDEWVFFDPNEYGFPALVAKLDEISARDDNS